ncbi:MAG TPA: hypothetical protein VK177_00760 [Flavobacteriales bacterium]|nr:hypothetical protein [Flavobacteriales bacterium]
MNNYSTGLNRYVEKAALYYNFFLPGFLRQVYKPKAIYIILGFNLVVANGFSQVFTEGIGTVGSTTTIVAHETANGFDNDAYTMDQGGATNPADIRATSVSSGYTGASGGANVFFTTTSGEYGFAIKGINTLGCTSMTIDFAVRKENAPGTAFATLVLEYSTNSGSSWTTIAFTAPATSSAAGWYLISGVSVPGGAASSNLWLRWRKTGTLSCRLDDIKLNGSCTTAENCSDGIDNDGDGLIDGADPDCSVNSITTGTIGGSPFAITCSAFVSTTVPFTTTGIFTAGNVFTAQLSDASGSFSFPLTIGTLTLSGTAVSGTIPSTILAGITPGTGYRIRVVSSSPSATGTDNGTNLTVTNSGSPCYGPIIINEVSQGASGNKEYIELLVVGNTPCGTVDIRNMIIDDNNGDFSGGPVASTGIANGHLRFSTHGQWSNVPSGSLIVIYNNADVNASLPADDVSDLLVPDKVYVLPANSSFLEGCSTLPAVGNASYTPCTYGTGNFNYLGLANGADAAQTRNPNGTYNHGVSWGLSPMNGGPDALNVGTSSSASQLIEFENTTSDSYTTAANFTRSNVPADETPGAANSALNNIYIISLTCLTLPVELIDFSVINVNMQAKLRWETASEKNCSHYEVQRAGNDAEFITIGQVGGNGTTNYSKTYGFTDSQPLSGQSYYRLKQVDFDGAYTFLKPLAFNLENSSLSNSRFDGKQIILAGCNNAATIQVFTATGSLVMTKSGEQNFSLEELGAGYYLVRIVCGMQYFNLPVSKAN